MRWALDRPISMTVRVVHVGDVRVRVPHPLMSMPMRMRLSGWIGGSMIMLVVRIVNVRVGMFHRLVLMLVLVELGEVQPDADRHQ